MLVKTLGLKEFESEIETAFHFLSAMILNDKKTRFWFASSNGNISGELALYINSGEFCRSIDEYKSFDEKEHWNEDFYLLNEVKQEELRAISLTPQQKFMMEFGNELKSKYEH